MAFFAFFILYWMTISTILFLQETLGKHLFTNEKLDQFHSAK